MLYVKILLNPLETVIDNEYRYSFGQSDYAPVSCIVIRCVRIRTGQLRRKDIPFTSNSAKYLTQKKIKLVKIA